MAILKNLALEESKLVVMLDGVDEVSDYKEQVKCLIKTLIEKYKLKQIIMTTRTNLKEELEDCFETISFDLKNFDTNDQMNFLVKYWHSHLNTDMNVELKLKQSADILLKNLKLTLTESIHQLIGIPLQTKMIADIFLINNDMSHVRSINKIADLYHEFIEKRFNIQFEEKYKIDFARNKVLYEREKERFYEEHIRLASSVLLKRKELDVVMNVSSIIVNRADEERIVRFGLIVNFKYNVPTFVHQSFVEYFVAKYAVNKIIHQDDDDEEFRQLLRNDEYFLIRKFLDSLMKIEGITNFEKANLMSKNLCNELTSWLMRSIIFSSVDYKVEIEKCCEENLLILLKYLLDIKRANIAVNNDFLILASRRGHIEIVRLLIDKGININQTNKDGQNALHWACENGHNETVQLLIQKGVDTKQKDIFRQNALHWASRRGHKELVQLLMGKGLDANEKDKFGKSALHWAWFYDHKEVVQLLIEKGIDIHQQNNDGQNALHWASSKGHKDVVHLLVEKGIDINLKDGLFKQNALHFAAEKGYYDIVQLLIEKGVDINQTNYKGENALNLATNNGHKEIEELLTILFIGDVAQLRRFRSVNECE